MFWIFNKFIQCLLYRDFFHAHAGGSMTNIFNDNKKYRKFLLWFFSRRFACSTFLFSSCSSRSAGKYANLTNCFTGFWETTQEKLQMVLIFCVTKQHLFLEKAFKDKASLDVMWSLSCHSIHRIHPYSQEWKVNKTTYTIYIILIK